MDMEVATLGCTYHTHAHFYPSISRTVTEIALVLRFSGWLSECAMRMLENLSGFHGQTSRFVINIQKSAGNIAHVDSKIAGQPT